MREASRLSHFLKRRTPWRTSLILSALGLVATIAIGSWWTAGAIADGQPGWTFVRFALTVALGTYYVFWFNTSRDARQIQALVNSADAPSD